MVIPSLKKSGVIECPISSFNRWMKEKGKSVPSIDDTHVQSIEQSVAANLRLDD